MPKNIEKRAAKDAKNAKDKYVFLTSPKGDKCFSLFGPTFLRQEMLKKWKSKVQSFGVITIHWLKE